MLNATQGLSLLVLLLCCCIFFVDAQVVLSSLHIENKPSPVEALIKPSFSWTLGPPECDITQTSYQILVSGFYPGSGDIWNSGPTMSDQTQLIEYTGPQLISGVHYIWSVNVTTSAGSGIASSGFVASPSPSHSGHDSRLWGRDKPSSPISSIFQSSSWIWSADAGIKAAPIGNRSFWYNFTTPPGQTVQSALVFLSVDNQFSLYVHGDLVGESKDWETASCYNVSLPSLPSTTFLIRGANNDEPDNSSNPAGLLAEIQVALTDGTSISIPSNNSWRSSSGNFDMSRPAPNPAPVTTLAKFGEGPWQNRVKPFSSCTPHMIQLPVTSPDSMRITPPSANPPPPHTSPPPHPPAPASVSPPSSPTSISPPSSTEPSSSTTSPETNKNPDVGGIVGGVLGGVIFVLLVLVLYLWWLQKQSHRTPSATQVHHSLDIEHGDTYSTWSMSQDIPSSVSSRRYFPSISPSMSISAVAERNCRNREAVQRTGYHAGIELKVRLQRLEELVLALDREVSSGANDNIEIARLRARVAELTGGNNITTVIDGEKRPDSLVIKV